MSTSPTSFFATVQSLGAVPYSKAKAAKLLDPLDQAKAKFARQADEQIKLIKSAADKGLWFKREGEAVIVSLKNGVAVINKEQPAFTLANASQAVNFIEAARDACSKGEFDTLLKETNRGPRNAQPAPEAAAASTPSVAPKPAAKRK